MERIDLVEISSSDDEKDLKPFFSQVSPCDSPDKDSSSLVKPTENESNKKLTITVEDTPHTTTNNKSTKIVINIDEVMSNQETNEVNSKENQNDNGIVFDGDFTLEFSQLIELCLKYEFSDGMVRILKKNLIPVYKLAERSYTESTAFQCFLEDIIMKMQRNPSYKFSCLKSVCENLKSNAPKKRVNLVTLDTEVTEHRKKEFQQLTVSKEQKVSDVIEIDGDKDDVCIDVDAVQDDVIFIDEKENSVSANNITANVPSTPTNFNNVLAATTDSDLFMKSKIQALEEEIMRCKKMIETLDEMEVDDASNDSPYILVDRYKSRIVNLYKEYCALTGTESFEHRCHEVNITVMGGPPGPAKRLQGWLSQNFKDDGDPAFPDFIDVLKCVTEASEEDNLFWTKTQIFMHSQMLFSQCGKALQKRRKKREWRDLVYKKDVSKDPADEDPALMAQLEANRQLARIKEKEILNYYAALPTYNPKSAKNIVLQNQVTNDNATTSNFGTDFVYPEVPVVIANNIQLYSEKNADKQSDAKPLLVSNPIDSEKEILCSESDDYSTSDHEDFEFDLDMALNVANNNNSNVIVNNQVRDPANVESINNATVSQVTDDERIIEAVKGDAPKVKPDPDVVGSKITAEETLKLLLQFDETALESAEIKTTVFDFDPLLTVDISSSDSESDCDILAENDT